MSSKLGKIIDLKKVALRENRIDKRYIGSITSIIDINKEDVNYTPFTYPYTLGNKERCFQALINTCIYSSNYIDTSITHLL